MPFGILHSGSAIRTRRPLAAHGGIARTFGSLASFLAVTFFCCGAYLLEDVFAHPITAGSGGIIAGAVVVALAIITFFYLFWPRRRSYRWSSRHGWERWYEESANSLALAEDLRIMRSSLQRELPFRSEDSHGNLEWVKRAESPGSSAPRESFDDATHARR